MTTPLAVITGEYKTLGGQRGLQVERRIREGVPKQVASCLNHLYYWAPLILIGNGL